MTRTTSAELRELAELRRRTAELEARVGLRPPATAPDEAGGLAGTPLGQALERGELLERLALTERLISVGALVGGVAHELNSPVSYVSTNLQFVQEALQGSGLPVATDVLEALKDARQGADRIRAIAEELRAFARRLS